MTCPIPPVMKKGLMCNPPSLIQKTRGSHMYHNIVSAYGSPVSTKERFEQGLACIEQRKTAIAPCSDIYLKCKGGVIYKERCTNGTIFNAATSTCTDKTKVSLC